MREEILFLLMLARCLILCVCDGAGAASGREAGPSGAAYGATAPALQNAAAEAALRQGLHANEQPTGSATVMMNPMCGAYLRSSVQTLLCSVRL